MKPNRSRRINMDDLTIEHGKECSGCLRWFVPIHVDDGCPYCQKWGCPPSPNRVRYLAVKNGISLREICRKSRLNWRTIRLVSQGRRAPRRATERKILRAMGLSVRKAEVRYAFPYSRHV